MLLWKERYVEILKQTIREASLISIKKEKSHTQRDIGGGDHSNASSCLNNISD
jgi:hypothetical protein